MNPLIAISVFLLALQLKAFCAEQPDSTSRANIRAVGITGSPRSTLGLGTITKVETLEASRWRVTTANNISLFGKKMDGNAEFLMGVSRARGYEQVSARQEWVGKTVLFCAVPEGQVYRLPETDMDSTQFFSPNQRNWYVWEKEAPEEIAALKKVSSYFSLDDMELKERMLNTVDDKTMPLFLRELACGRVFGYTIGDKSFTSQIAGKFVLWRDTPELPIWFRLKSDELAALNLPASYKTDAKRLAFLTSIVDAKETAQWEKQTASQRLTEIQ